MPKLGVIIASVREGRAGAAVGEWFADIARRHAEFDVTVIDLLHHQLPLLQEPNHPRLHRYTHDYTIAWSEVIEPMDAFVLILPEYNYGAPPALLNALDYLYREWHYKPVGIVSYGALAAGTRSAQMIKLVLLALKMVPIFECVTIPFIAEHRDKATGALMGVDEKPAVTMLNELVRWTSALASLRNHA